MGKNIKPMQFTDHSLIRYLERVIGLDVEVLKSRIIPDETQLLIDQLGDGEFPCGDYNIVVKDRTVITVIEAK